MRRVRFVTLMLGCLVIVLPAPSRAGCLFSRPMQHTGLEGAFDFTGTSLEGTSTLCGGGVLPLRFWEQGNFEDANSPTWKLEFADTGHFAFSDLAGLSDYFAAGCGDGVRQTDDTAFTYAETAANYDWGVVSFANCSECGVAAGRLDSRVRNSIRKRSSYVCRLGFVSASG